MKKLIIVFAIGIFFVASDAHAAVVSFDPQEKVVGTASPFLVGVNLSSDNPINVISLSIIFPDGFEPVDVSDGNSIIPMWIERPHYDPRTQLLSFSGMIPGGFSGTNGRVITLTVKATGPGNGFLYIDPSTARAYQNADPPTPETVLTRSLFLTANDKKVNISNILPDTNPPEQFTPSIAHMPNDSGASWMLVFATQDKVSGIDSYEVREVNPLLPWIGEWHKAESPYRLIDQELRSRIDIRAYDKSGNVREESIAPTNTNVAILVTFLGLLCAAIIIGALWGAKHLRRGE